MTDSDPMNNRFVLDTPLSLTARFSLSIDTVYEINNSTLSGFYAKLIEVPAEKSILIDLDYNGSEPIVYTSFEKIPTQFDFELRSVKNINKVNSVRLTIPTTLNGTYYFYFWSETASFQLNIKAYYPSLQITKISPNQIYLNGKTISLKFLTFLMFIFRCLIIVSLWIQVLNVEKLVRLFDLGTGFESDILYQDCFINEQPTHFC